MVIGTHIKCDLCDTVFKLRFQMDNSYKTYDLPIYLDCPNCGNKYTCRLNRKMEIFPIRYRAADTELPSYDISYSPQLPILEELYYNQSIAFSLTPFLALWLPLGGGNIKKHEYIMHQLLSDVFPQRKLFSSLLPIMKKGNEKAFKKQMLNICKITQTERRINSVQDCLDTYNDLVYTACRALSSEEYNNRCLHLVKRFSMVIKAKTKEELKCFHNHINPFFNLSNWRWDAWDYVGKFMDCVEQYFQAMFYASVGDFTIPHQPHSCIMTIDPEKVKNDYCTSYKRLSDCLTFLLGLNNWDKMGDYNGFINTSESMKGIINLEMFHKIPEGLKIDKLVDEIDIMDYLCGGLDNRVRNGYGHQKDKYKPNSQLIEFYYKSNDDTNHFDLMLIDVCYMTFINTLHIMEATTLIHELKKKIQ